jgi:hypothetical protein
MRQRRLPSYGPPVGSPKQTAGQETVPLKLRSINAKSAPGPVGADMTIGNLVKVTIFLSDRKYALENRQARQEALGDHAPALTVIIAGIFDEAWLLETEAIAEA